MKLHITLTKKELFQAILSYVQLQNQLENWEVNTIDTYISSDLNDSTISLHTKELNGDKLHESTQETQTKPINSDDDDISL